MVAIASHELRRAQEYARKHSIPKAYGSYAELAQDPDVGEHLPFRTGEMYVPT